MHQARVALLTVASLAIAAFAKTGMAQSGPAASQLCGKEGPATLFCGPMRAEDLYRIPNTNWVVSSALGGGIHLIDARTKTSFQLYPSPEARERFDKATYSTCPGPPDAAERASFSTLGVALRLGPGNAHTLYATRWPNVSRVQVFELDMNGTRPSVTWIGCVEAPDRVLLNAIAPLPDGGFLASNFYERGPNPTAGRDQAVAGENTGELLRWHPRTGFSKVPGSDASGPNGIELSRDGGSVYFAEWGRYRVVRLSLRADASRRETMRLDFRPDNVHWAPDGTLLVAGSTEKENVVVKIDPETLRVTELMRSPDTETYFHASVAIQVDDEIWLGSARANRIAIYPLPRK